MKPIEYFLEITKIPRPSGKEEQIVKYLVNFAKTHNLEYITNNNNCIIIKKNNNSKNSIILQAHTDMVCEKLKGIEIDFDTEPIQTIIEGDYIKANGTTLGADDGYGVAIILSVLEQSGEGYPNIEAIFTSDEEVGMTGATSLDCSGLKSNMVIGLDGTSSSEITISCAGSQRIEYSQKYKVQKTREDGLCLSVSGLMGGHSGEEINLNRANANKIAFEFLSLLKNPVISSFNGGNKDNAIPRESQMEFVCDNDFVSILKIFEQFKLALKEKYPNEVKMNLELDKVKIEELVEKTISSNLINFVNEFQDAVLVYDEHIENFPITSINLAKIQVGTENILIRSMLRSSDKKLEEKFVENYIELGKKFNFNISLGDKSPYFERSKNHILEDVCVSAYRELGYENLKVSGIHAGLEGGVFAEKIKDAQVVCLGADLFDIHTPNEMMKISSLDKLANWLKQILVKINNLK